MLGFFFALRWVRLVYDVAKSNLGFRATPCNDMRSTFPSQRIQILYYDYQQPNWSFQDSHCTRSGPRHHLRIRTCRYTSMVSFTSRTSGLDLSIARVRYLTNFIQFTLTLSTSHLMLCDQKRRQRCVVAWYIPLLTRNNASPGRWYKNPSGENRYLRVRLRSSLPRPLLQHY